MKKTIIYALFALGAIGACKTVHLQNGLYITVDQFADATDAESYMGYAAISRVPLEESAPEGFPIIIKTERSYRYASTNESLKTGPFTGEVNADIIKRRKYKLDIGGSLKLLSERKDQTLELQKKAQVTGQKSLGAKLTEKAKNQTFAIDAFRLLREENLDSTLKVTRFTNVAKYRPGHTMLESNIKKNSCGWFGLRDMEPNAYIIKAFQINGTLDVEIKKSLSVGFKAAWDKLAQATKDNVSLSVHYESGTGGKPDKYYINITGAWSAIEVATFSARRCR